MFNFRQPASHTCASMLAYVRLLTSDKFVGIMYTSGEKSVAITDMQIGYRGKYIQEVKTTKLLNL
jgi:hypothetical protein